MTNKNGLAKNWDKLKSLWAPYWEKMEPHVKRWLRMPTPHNWTNIMTESSRADAYVNGHIMIVYFYGSVIAMVWLWLK